MADQNIIYTELSPDIEHIKIHGLQRSGTNYLAHLIDENFIKVKSLVNLGGWKHGHYSAPWHLGKEVHVAMIAKNPYSWLVSLFKYWGPNKKLRIGPDLDGVSFEEFVKNRCYFERQKDIPYLFRASNPIQQWNNMHFHWMSIRMNGKALFAIPYERLVQDIDKALGHMETVFQLKRKNFVVNCDQTFTPSGEITKPSNKKWDKKFYENSEYMKWYTQSLLDFVNSELDMDVMIKLGYDYIMEAEKC